MRKVCRSKLCDRARQEASFVAANEFDQSTKFIAEG